MFRVGQKVVCIKYGVWTSCTFGEISPQLECVYTIRDIFPGRDVPTDLYFHLEEIRNPPKEYRFGVSECRFWSGHFRPVVERKTDISLFTEMLTPTKRKVEA